MPLGTEIVQRRGIHAYCTPVLGAAKTDKVVSLVWSMESVRTLGELIGALRPGV